MNYFLPSVVRHLLISTLGLLLIFLSGCAVTPDNWAFRKEIINNDALSKVKRIALLDVPTPSNIVLGDQFSETATAWFGIIGMFTVEDTEGNKILSGELVSEVTRTELKKWLEQAGMEVVLVEPERKNKSKMLGSYEQFSQIDPDAILEVAPVVVGFEFELGKVTFRESKREVSPVFYYKYRLVSAENGEVLIQSNVYYSAFDYSEIPWEYSANRFIVGNKIRGPSWHIFENMDAVKNNQEEAVNRLTYGIKRATKMISVMVTY